MPENTAIAPHKTQFSSAGYLIPEDASNLDIVDAMTLRLAHLRAMLHAIANEGLETFDNMDDALRQDFLGSCLVAVAEVSDLARSIKH